jgi:GAF domain-containing protein
MLIGPGDDAKVVASSSEVMRVLELFELQAAEGPCFDCLRSGQPVIDGDLGIAASRWPRFSVEATAAGFRSASAVPMRLRTRVLGALNLFRRKAGPMADEDVDVAQAFADIATIAIVQHHAAAEASRLNENLTHALNSRIVIEQAKGVLAERTGVAMTDAFERLRRHAREHNLRLADLARSVVSGETTEDTLDPLTS